jgi:hypothetical protein
VGPWRFRRIDVAGRRALALAGKPGGGDAPSVTAAEPYQGRTALRLCVCHRKGYGNSMLEPVSVPPEAYGVRFSLFVERAASASAMHLWFREKDGDMWMCR